MLIPHGYMYHYDSLVLPEWRGQGIHPAMVRATKEFAKEHGCQRALSVINAVASGHGAMAKQTRAKRVVATVP